MAQPEGKKQAAGAHHKSGGNGKKHFKTPELAMAKKAHAEEMLPMDDEVLKQF